LAPGDSTSPNFGFGYFVMVMNSKPVIPEWFFSASVRAGG
jgi:hypothetical protein